MKRRREEKERRKATITVLAFQTVIALVLLAVSFHYQDIYSLKDASVLGSITADVDLFYLLSYNRI